METANQAKGHLHPISQTIWQVSKIFAEMGFVVAEGPEIETEFYNFDALNIPGDHPARDMWDTFWLRPSGGVLSEHEGLKHLLRTQTSPVQIRYMENNKPPLRIISLGKVFRNEATDNTHEAQFYQVEGLVVGKDISLANLKTTLETFFSKFFGEAMEVRFRPSFFPFVEPAVEVDMKKVGSDKWLEVMGAGLVHPKVLQAVGLDPKEWSGFAFGGGVDRLAMLKYGVDDIRTFYQDDMRFLEQF